MCPSPAVDLTYRVDRVEPGRTHRVREVLTRPGGKAVNVARLLHQLGEAVCVIAPVGGGTGGAEFATALRATGIPAELVPSAPDTRRTVTVTDGVHATVFSEPGRINGWATLIDAVTQRLPAASAVVVGGSLPDGAPVDGCAEIALRCHAAGVAVLVDTSGPALAAAAGAAPTVLKPNADELGELTGDGDPHRAAASLAASGSTVLASLGADGLLSVRGAQTWHARVAAPLAGNATGAGDAVVAAAARGLARGTAWPDVLADCVALAAAAVLSPVAGEVDLAHVAAQRAGALVTEVVRA